ncbi:MAG: hypothetical protein HFJ33_06835 [Clostridia bacterium]|nr:hypothetical protein [Clostridia bacterium]
MEQYVLLYGDKKPEDNICITNMFQNAEPIHLGWTDLDFNYNKKIIEKHIKEGTKQLIFSGLEIGWDKLIKDIKEKNPEIKIKVICNTQDSLLYYEYERENFFKLLALSKEGIIQDIAFLRKSQYETYQNLGYQCSYLKENYQLKEEKKVTIKLPDKKVDLGIYPLNYTWDKNIFNQLCIAKMMENCHLNYHNLDERMEDFLTTMEIDSSPDKIEKIEEKELISKLSKNDVVVATSFTEYVHPVFFISMELGIPCLIGNNSDFFEENDELKKYVVTNAEDNAIINAKMVKTMIENKEKIQKLYKIWKENYNHQAQKTMQDFINQ